jgi:hypothetical protein
MNRLNFVDLKETTFTSRYQTVIWRAYVAVDHTINWMQTKISLETFDYYFAGKECKRLANELNCSFSIGTKTFPVLSWNDLELRVQLTLREEQEREQSNIRPTNLSV